jgi:rSAM/selenodomain-associated transferase 1
MSAATAPAQHLLVFARHPELGKVKTRLAAGIGDEAALAVYRELLAHTRAVAQALPAHKTVWLAETPTVTPDKADEWPGYEQQLQFPGDLGTRMLTAFAHAFEQGARAVLIVGTDCPGLSAAILEQAYTALATHDIVIGPAEDGGYYLLGMKELCQDIFLGKSWSTDSVLAHTLADADRLGLTVAQLPMLRDVDDAADLAAWRATSA